MIGKTVSHYRIVGSLGAGGMGVVYAGEDIRLHRPVALKFVPDDLAKDRAAVERLNSEARTASSLNHPNICTIYDIGEYEGQPFIVMELLKGHSLRERLEGAPLKVREVLEMGIQVADALDAAHQRSVIHRDIKPANLFVLERGQVKVLDFGLAKLVSRRSDIEVTAGVTRDRTADGITLGTVSYMSPEQVTGEDLDGRSDLFSLGVVLYEALTGHQPFTGKTSAVIFSAILTRAPVAPIVLNPEVPLRLQEVVNNCLEKDRELRYQNAADLRADLKRVRRDLESGQSGVFRTTSAVPVMRTDRPSAAGHDTATNAVRASADTASATAAVRNSSSAEQVRRGNTAIIGAAVLGAAVVIGGALWLRPRPSSPAAATASAPQSVRTQLAAATASLESKDYRAALTYAEEALRLAPDDRDAIRIREAARAILSRFDTAVAQAGERLAAGDAEGAKTALDAARAIDPTAPVLADLSVRIAGLPRAKASDPRRDAATVTSEPARARPLPPAPVPAAPRPSPAATTPPAQPEPIVSRTPSRSEPPRVDATIQPSPAVPPATPPAVSAPASPPSPPAVAPAPAVTPPPSTRSDAAERRDPPAAAHPAESDEAAIRRVIAAYARAIETKDLALFRTVKPNMTPDEQRRIELGFRAVSSQQVAITIAALDIKGTTASVQLKRRDTIQAAGRQQTSDILQTMTLTRAASGWVIQEIGR